MGEQSLVGDQGSLLSSPWWVISAVPTLRPGVWENSQMLHFERHLWELKQVTLSQWVWRWCPWQEAGGVSVVCRLSQQATLSLHRHLVRPSVLSGPACWPGVVCPAPLQSPHPFAQRRGLLIPTSLLPPALLLWTSSSDFPLDIFLCLESSAC